MGTKNEHKEQGTHPKKKQARSRCKALPLHNKNVYTGYAHEPNIYLRSYGSLFRIIRKYVTNNFFQIKYDMASQLTSLGTPAQLRTYLPFT